MPFALEFRGVFLDTAMSGLANRIRGWASCWSLCQLTGSSLRVRWTPNWACPGVFSEAFSNLGDTATVVLDPNERSRQDELYIGSSTSPKSGAAATSFFEEVGTKLGLESVKFHALCHDFIRQLQPSDAVEQTRLKLLSGVHEERYIGLHLRGGDHTKWRRERGLPAVRLEGVLDSLQREAITVGVRNVFVASDEPELLRQAVHQLNERDLSPFVRDFSMMQVEGKAASRVRSTNLTESAVDLFLLKGSECIFGTTGSSFSRLASQMSGSKLYSAYS